jgi:hypothetical protein
MKHVQALTLLVIMTAPLITSCKKSVVRNTPMASITVTNAVVNGPSIRLGNDITTVYNNYFSSLNIPVGDRNLYVWPVGDSTHPYYTNSKFTAADREVYSLFIAGEPGSTTGVLIKDNMPYHTDSTFGVRFINLVPDSPPLMITLSTTPTVSEVNNLNYLQYTDFKIYPGRSTPDSYTFEARLASDGSLVASTTIASSWFSSFRFANMTVVVSGMIGSPSMFYVSNDR